jgi:Spy/CpxP family protein refolding chaperone
MAEENQAGQAGQAGGTPLWRRRSIWLGGGIVAGLAALAALAPRAWALHGWSGHGGSWAHRRGGFGAHLLKDPEGAKRHAGMAVEWALRGVDASEGQKAEARRITDRLVDGLGPLAAKHREHREAIHGMLAGSEVDRAALEQLRRQELTLADQASKLAVDAFADLAEVLTPQQRQELVGFARRFHGGVAQ